jgi:hypothetical protein
MVLLIETRGSARERGVQQGEQLKECIQAAKNAVFHSEIFKEAKPSFIPLPIAVGALGLMGKGRIKPYVEQFPRQHDRLLGIAEGAGLGANIVYGMNFIEVMAGNPRTSYTRPLVQACSMVFALPEATVDGEIIYGRNYDFPGVLQPYQMVRRETPDDGAFKTITLTQYPMVGAHIGLNEKGVVIGYNYGRSWKTDPLDYRPRGLPTMIALQEALETCATTQEVIDFVTKLSIRATGAHYGVLDESGDACVIETTATRFAIRRPASGILVHTNMYQDLIDANVPNDVMYKYKGQELPYVNSPKERFSRASELLSAASGNVTLDTIKAILSDHAGREPDDCTVCTHGKTGITLASILVKPRDREFWVADNQPCKTPYEKFTL